MYFNMSVKATEDTERFITCITHVWFLTSVYFKMSVAVTDLREGLPHISHLYGFSPVCI